MITVMTALTMTTNPTHVLTFTPTPILSPPPTDQVLTYVPLNLSYMPTYPLNPEIPRSSQSPFFRYPFPCDASRGVLFNKLFNKPKPYPLSQDIPT